MSKMDVASLCTRIIVIGMLADVMSMFSPLIVHCINMRSIMPFILGLSVFNDLRSVKSCSRVSWPMSVLTITLAYPQLWLLVPLAVVTCLVIIPQSLLRLVKTWRHCKFTSYRVIASDEDAEF